MAGLGGIGNSWAVGMVIFNIYMFCVNVVWFVEKGRVYVVDKMNVEFWGLFLMLIKM